MMLSDVISRMNDGIKAGEMAKQLNVGEKRLRAVLHEAEYKYNQSSKRWDYTGEGIAPDMDVMAVLSSSPKRRKNVTSEGNPESVSTSQADSRPNSHGNANKGVAHDRSNEINSIFTPDQLNALIQIANERIHQDQSQSMFEHLHTRIIRLHTQSKTRKTIVIDSDVADTFDAFCERMKLQKSDLIALAMIDFMDKYEMDK